MLCISRTFIYTLLTTALILLVFPYEAQAATIGRPANNLGLVGYWDFDTGKFGRTAYDRSGNGNDGILSFKASSVDDWVDGKVGTGFNFDGLEDFYITVPNASSLNPDYITISAWVKFNTAVGRDFVISKGQATSIANGQYYFDYTSDEKLRFNISDGTSGHDITSDTTLNSADVWYHIVGTYDGNTQRLYIDGVLDGTPASWTGVIGDTTNDLALGNRSRFYNIPFDGVLDDVRIYNRALSEGEIRRLYNSGLAGRPKLGVTPGAVTDGLVGHWTFDGPDLLENATDISGQGNTGYLINFTSTTTTSGPLGQALEFDGGDDYVDINGLPNFDKNSDYTWTFWIKPLSASSGDILAQDDSSACTGYYIDHDSNIITFHGLIDSLGCTANSQAVASVNSGEWSHVVFTLVGGESRVYVNGIFKNSSTDGLNSDTGGGTEAIGVGNISSTYFNGLLDDVRIYNRALFSDEIQRLYNVGVASKVSKTHTNHLNDGLVGHWTFDGPDLLENATDISGQGNTGYLINFTSTTTTSGPLGQALEFDGGDDSVDISHDGSIDFSRTDPFSIFLWMRTTEATTYGPLVNKLTSSPQYRGYYIQRGDGSGDPDTEKILAVGILNDWNTDTSIAVAGDSVINDGNWHHVGFTYNGTGVAAGVALYVDGVSETKTVATDGLGSNTINNTQPLTIGRELTDLYFDGDIDDVRVYNRALSADEAFKLYNLGR